MQIKPKAEPSLLTLYSSEVFKESHKKLRIFKFLNHFLFGNMLNKNKEH